MTGDLLRDTLRHRAARATVPDRDTVLAAVREHRELRARRRRNAVAAGGGTAVMAGLVAGTVLLVPDHPGNDGSAPAGGPPASAPTRHHTSAAAPAAPSSSPAVTAPSPQVTTTLHKVPAAPASAPLSVRLVPAKWRYLASADDATLYGPPGIKNPGTPDDFEGRIALLVGERYAGDLKPNLHIKAYPANYHSDSGYQILAIDVSAKRNVTIQVPASAHLTKDQVLVVANTLDIRDLKHPAKG